MDELKKPQPAEAIINTEIQGGLPVELQQAPETMGEFVDRDEIAKQEAQKESGLQVQIETITPISAQFTAPVTGVVLGKAVNNGTEMVVETRGTGQLNAAALVDIVGQRVAQPAGSNGNLVMLGQPVIRQISGSEQLDKAA